MGMEGWKPTRIFQSLKDAPDGQLFRRKSWVTQFLSFGYRLGRGLRVEVFGGHANERAYQREELLGVAEWKFR